MTKVMAQDDTVTFDGRPATLIETQSSIYAM